MKTHATENTSRIIKSLGVGLEYKCGHLGYFNNDYGYTTNREIISLLDGKLAVLGFCYHCQSHTVCVFSSGQRIKTRYDNNDDISQIISVRAGVIAYKTRNAVIIWNYNQDQAEVIETMGDQVFTPLSLLVLNGQLLCCYSYSWSANYYVFNFTTRENFSLSHGVRQAASLSNGSVAISLSGDPRIFIGDLTTNTFRVWDFAWMDPRYPVKITALADNHVGLNDGEFIYVVNVPTGELRYRVNNNPAFRDMTVLANGQIALITHECRIGHFPPIFLGQIVKPCVLEAKRAVNMMAQANRSSKNNIFKKLPVDMCVRIATMLTRSEYHEYLLEYTDKSFDFKPPSTPRTFLGRISSYFFPTLRRNPPWIPDATPIKTSEVKRDSLKHSR